MRKQFLFSFLIFLILGLGNDNNVLGQTKLPEIIRASPEAESLGQYGGVPVNLSTGKISHIIPIYTITIGEFQYPLYIAYNYDGLKASSVPSMLGMGWVANFSGAVIREVKGLPDDEPFKGYFLNGSKYENYDSLPTSEKVQAMSNAANGTWDTNPDKFLINTQTINGNFRFNTSKKPVFNDHRNYKVTINNIPFNSGFDVQNDDGVMYQFRDAEVQHDWYLDTTTDNQYFNSWMLSKIVLPTSNSTIDFSYTTHVFTNTSKWFTKSIKDYGYYESSLDGWQNRQNYYNTDSKILESINFPNGNIQFSYTTNTVSNCYDLTGVAVGCTSKKLSTIIITNLRGELIEKYIFDYYDYGAYYFLKTIKKEDKNGNKINYYEFNYNISDNTGLYPVPSSRIENGQVDLWGYYNGSTFNYTATDNELFNSLKPNWIKGKIGTLSKIKYPTGGTTEILYEPNSVPGGGYYVQNNPVYGFPDNGGNIEIGGLRVAKTIDCPGNSGLNCVEKSYKYVGVDGVNSSGIMADPYPRFKGTKTYYRHYIASNGFKDPLDGTVYGFNPILDEEYWLYTENYMPISSLLTNGGHVNYSRVETLLKNAELGKEVKNYSIFNNSYMYSDPMNYDFPNLYEDFDYKNGKLLKHDSYSFAAVNPKQQITNYYDGGELTFDSSKFASQYEVFRSYTDITTLSSTGVSLVDDQLFRFTKKSIKHFQKSYMPVSSIKALDENNGNISVKENYSYDPNLGYLRKKDILGSDGTKLVQSFKFPTDLVNVEQFSSMQELIDSNRISKPISVTISKIDEQNNETKISEEHTKFGRSSSTANYLLPIETHKKKGAGNIDVTVTDDLDIIISKYDNQGNIVENKLKDGIFISYIWGYNQQYPIAKIENATYSQVSSYVTNLQNLSNTGTEADLITALNNLRNDNALSNAMVTTYTYKPLIGMTTMTDPKGYTTYYEYDDFNRLKQVKDADGKILSANEYHYKN